MSEKSTVVCLFVLPEFLKVKEANNADFFKMVQTPELACELTLQVNGPFTSYILKTGISFGKSAHGKELSITVSSTV